MADKVLELVAKGLGALRDVLYTELYTEFVPRWAKEPKYLQARGEDPSIEEPSMRRDELTRPVYLASSLGKLAASFGTIPLVHDNPWYLLLSGYLIADCLYRYHAYSYDAHEGRMPASATLAVDLLSAPARHLWRYVGR